MSDNISAKQGLTLLISLLVVALCGIVYELIVGTISSYLLGNSVYQFSITIGLFMFSMGVGSFITKHLNNRYVENFIAVEIIIAIVGGLSGVVLFTVFPFARIFYELTMYAIIFAIGCLVGMEIPILTSLLSLQRGTKQTVADVMSFDYLGALIGSVAFPLLLLPSLGLLHSSFVIGLINALVALSTLIIFRNMVTHFRFYMTLNIVVLVGLIAFNVFGAFFTRYAEKHLYFDQIIHSEQTPYQKLVFTRSSNFKDHRLFIDGNIQFSSRDEYRYHEYLVHPVMSIPGSRDRVLVLGGGDGLALREVLKYKDVKQVDLVDIDPRIIELAKTLPVLRELGKDSFQDPRVTTYNEDAFTFLNQAGPLYNRVIIDFPDPHNEALSKLYSKEFYTIVRKRLAQDGALVTQSSSPFFARRAFWCINATLAAIFDQTLAYNTALPSFGIWGFNLATSGASIPSVWDIDVPTKAIRPATLAKAMVFDNDIGQVKTLVNSLFTPKLYQFYAEDIRN
ncbi:MAG: polyamine aminopropyltransferase [Sedimenticola sp.]